MKILLLGKSGQVGWELQRSLAPLGELVSLDRHSQEFCGNLSDLAGLRETMRQVRPDVIVNAAAYTAVDAAESDQRGAHCVNADAVGLLAQEAALQGAWLIHYSTDYVFDGSGETPWLESDVTAPVNWYGSTKRAGEELIVASGCKHLIFRTSWVYAARGGNFAKTMLRLAADRETLSVIADQIGAPTGAELLADSAAIAIVKAMDNPALSGIYHLAASGETSWHGYAQFVIDYARAQGQVLKVRSVQPIGAADYPTPAARPANSRLNTQKLREHFSLHLPDWQSGVTRMLMETLQK